MSAQTEPCVCQCVFLLVVNNVSQLRIATSPSSYVYIGIGGVVTANIWLVHVCTHTHTPTRAHTRLSIDSTRRPTVCVGMLMYALCESRCWVVALAHFSAAGCPSDRGATAFLCQQFVRVCFACMSSSSQSAFAWRCTYTFPLLCCQCLKFCC